MKIGIDLDNTIIDYSRSFRQLAVDEGWIRENEELSKPEVKARLVEEDGNDLRWQHLQALAYGTRINLARVFDGVKEFIRETREQGHEVVVISHKTEHSNYDPSVEFRKAALAWLEENGFFIEGMLDRDQVNFRSTLDEKVAKIAEEQCDFFIDDLAKVLDHEKFPARTFTVHFMGEGGGFAAKNWREIAEIFGDALMIQDKLGGLPEKVESLVRQGNNRIFKIRVCGRHYILKRYLISEADTRDRIGVEYSAIEAMVEAGFSDVPRVLGRGKNSAIYSFLEGSMSREPENGGMGVWPQFSLFLDGLKRLSLSSHFEKFSFGSDARTCLEDYFLILDRRISSIVGDSNDQRFGSAKSFIRDELYPAYESLVERKKSEVLEGGFELETQFKKDELILSPSDFGFHNCLLNSAGRVSVIDFEYFGWDDPAKLVLDFKYHVGQTVSTDFKKHLEEKVVSLFGHDCKLVRRLDLLEEMIQFEWILIVMNMFTAKSLERRLYASPHLNIDDLLEPRREKARSLFKSFLERE